MYYTPSHEWLTVRGNIGTVGITDYAQKELGEIVFIELPKVGQLLHFGQEVCVLESTKAAADVYAPVSGKIVEINEQIKLHPKEINKRAETSGWLFKLEIANPEELSYLLNRSKYEELVNS